MKEINFIPFFIQGFYSFELTDFSQIKNSLLNEIEKIYNSESSSIKSNFGGFQSKNILENEVISKIFSSISDELNEIYFHANIDGSKLKFINAWVNINDKPFHLNLEHDHEGVFSGVFYVNIDEGSGSIGFTNPMISTDCNLSKLAINPTPITNKTVEMQPLEGLVMIWPSFMRHYVLPNTQENCKRISIAFNIDID